MLHHGSLSPKYAFFEGGDHVLFVSVAHTSLREEFRRSKQPFPSLSRHPVQRVKLGGARTEPQMSGKEV